MPRLLKERSPVGASGSASGDLMRNAAGPTEIQVKVTAEDNSITVYVITVAGRTALERWQYEHFGSTRAKTGNAEDFDGDGVRNLAEFAFGTDPAVSASPRALNYNGNVITPGGITCEVVGGVPMAEFIRRSDYVALDLTYTVQFSSKLTTWETINVTPTVLARMGHTKWWAWPTPKCLTEHERSFSG